MSSCASTPELDAVDLAIIRVTQAGLPLVARPYEAVAAQVGVDAAEVMRRLEAMLATGVVRRIAAVPDHYRLGYAANGMSVWDVPDERVAVVGPAVGALPFVSHCYHRRRPPGWPYNLFAMVHGRSRQEVVALVDRIAALLSPDARRHEVLYSTAILKKTGLRIA